MVLVSMEKFPEPHSVVFNVQVCVPVLPGTASEGVNSIPQQLCPELLTAEEAVRYLRLDDAGGKNPERSLAYYRREWGLRATQIGRKLRYRRCELDRLLERLTEENPH